MTRDDILKMPVGLEIDKLIQSFVMDGLPPVSSDIMYEFIKPFSYDIKAAWEVVEKINNRIWSITYLPTDNVWQVAFLDIVPMAVIEAESAPLAICRAALLAVHYEDDKGKR